MFITELYAFINCIIFLLNSYQKKIEKAKRSQLASSSIALTVARANKGGQWGMDAPKHTDIFCVSLFFSPLNQKRCAVWCIRLLSGAPVSQFAVPALSGVCSTVVAM